MKSLFVLLVVAAVTTGCTAEADYRARVVVPGGPFHGVHGLAFGPDGALYAGDIMGLTVHRVDIATGRHEAAVGAPYGQADDVAFAPAGTPYAGTMVWTAVATGKVYARPPGGEPRIIAEGLPGVNTVGFSPTGQLYFTQVGREGALWSADLSGGPAEKLLDDIGPNGFVITEEGLLLGPHGATGSVISLDLDTMELTTVADGFNLPTAVKMDSRGYLYVLEFDGGIITRLDRATGERIEFARLEPGLDNIAIGPPDSDGAGKLYVSSIGRNGIFEIDLETRDVRTVVAGHLTAPGGIALGGDGSDTRAYIADLFSLRVVNPDSGEVSYVLPISALGPYPGTVSHSSLAGKGVLVTGSWFTGSVQVIDPAIGTVLREEWGLRAPYDVVISADGSLLIAESGAQQITAIRPDGARESLAAGFEIPVGLALADDQTLYVTDAGAGTISAIDLVTQEKRIVTGELQRPEGIAILPDGALAVVDSAARAVRRVDPDSGAMSLIAADIAVGLPAPDSFDPQWVFNGIAVDENGTLYLPSDTTASLVALQNH
jgi:sugar lactone lactonase YvrE